MTIGGGVMICPGVRIGRGALIAAGAVVNKGCPAGYARARRACAVRSVAGASFTNLPERLLPPTDLWGAQADDSWQREEKKK